jgi:hypothetical protein
MICGTNAPVVQIAASVPSIAISAMQNLLHPVLSHARNWSNENFDAVRFVRRKAEVNEPASKRGRRAWQKRRLAAAL